jgi:L-lactate dehydrogenase complex protein LldE
MARKVALFIPCFVDQLSPQVGFDTARVLRRIGYEVEFPQDQTCCGQPAFNAGHWSEARPCAERLLPIFAPYEYVVCPSGSCTTMVRTFYPELLSSGAAHDEVLALGQRVFEFSEFLVRVAGVADVGAAFPYKVTYHAACHATRELKIVNEPLALLRNVRGLELVSMPYSDECCGFGGMFSVKFGMISSAMGDTKAGNIESSGAEYVTAIDGSCLMHIEGILRRTRRNARTIHLASILAQEGAPDAPEDTPQDAR